LLIAQLLHSMAAAFPNIKTAMIHPINPESGLLLAILPRLKTPKISQMAAFKMNNACVILSELEIVNRFVIISLAGLFTT
jgi:hypothetical protein